MTPAELRSTRQRLGLTQAELAAVLGVTVKTIGRFERGTSAIPVRYELAVQGYLSQE
jgi:transcriptional regulator with XRE-family HTH domain